MFQHYLAELQGRMIVLATQHRKEEAIAPILKTELGLEIGVPEGLDTDQYGTFTREVKRPGTQLEAARQKAKYALELTGASVAIASEGAFLPHPQVPLVPCDREILVFVDQHYGLEIVAEELTLETNFDHTSVTSVEEALCFGQKIGFPSHGLIAMPNSNGPKSSPIIKGIVEEPALIESVRSLLKHYSSVHLETDMRAMYNPTRMAAIARAAQQLVKAIAQKCPVCLCPGFTVTERQPGLPCALCHSPTLLPQAEVYTCRYCQHRQTISLDQDSSLKKIFADPAQCLFCNP